MHIGRERDPLLVVISPGFLCHTNFYLRTKREMENESRQLLLKPEICKAFTAHRKLREKGLVKSAIVFMKACGWLFMGTLRKYRGIHARDVAKAMIKLSGLPGDKVVYESDELQDLAEQ
jgi:hypothetical protein